ncbi:MAG TPA: hypothetical protein VL400_21610, partial [Polyangiaceae bacterium]|nr:hypothetical protein [Polyangiaceae bacterium]
RVVPRAALDLLAHPDPRVAMAAARAAVFLDPAVAAPELVGRLEDESLLSVEVATTLAVFGAQAGPQHLRQLLARLVRTEATPSELAVAAGSSLAIVGDGRDAPLLSEMVQGEPGLLALLAWHGHPSFVAPLLARMDAIDSGTRTSATSALARIVLPADRLAHADEAEVRAAAARLAGSAAPRLRGGEAYRLEHSIDELARPDSVASARRTSWLEASIAARRPIPLDVDDWIGRQRRTLDGLLSKARSGKEPTR